MMEKPFFNLPQFSIKLSMIMFCGRFAGLFGPCLIYSQSNPGNIAFSPKSHVAHGRGYEAVLR